jgi:2-polyprenyl-6-hydroxyphenyl methylase/3-demethylubiquinone-9 3-methyltransferase
MRHIPRSSSDDRGRGSIAPPPGSTVSPSRLQSTSQSSAETTFGFGENWRRFLEVLDEDRIREAERSLCEMLECTTLSGLRFLDIGSGSGLFSLAAFRLGAERIHSLDVDPSCVSCTQELRSRWAPRVADWQVECASVLDRENMESLGQFDIVYAWGVLHHTGNMSAALENAANAVVPGGRLFISIYNDQGARSTCWRTVKRWYNRLPRFLRVPYVLVVMGPRELASAFRAVVRLRPGHYIRTWTEYKRQRGMSRWHDLVDWVGGYPFEVASPEAILNFYRRRGFRVNKLVRRRSRGCNEFVFEREAHGREALAHSIVDRSAIEDHTPAFGEAGQRSAL